MDLGEKLRQARLDAGLSQRQLCGEEITRNMLSQIEHGAARPSMKTLQYLAARLGKPVSYFLEESAVLSPNQAAMGEARRCFDAGDWSGALEALESYREPDPVYDRERQLLWVCCHLALAQRALAEGRELYALSLLERIQTLPCYCAQALERQRLLLMGQASGKSVSQRLPSLDAELLLRARDARMLGDNIRAARLLDAAEDQTDPQWCLLRGELYLLAGQFVQGARCLHGAEEAFPRQAAEKLEICYRELGDYKRAYEYACKQKR